MIEIFGRILLIILLVAIMISLAYAMVNGDKEK